MTFLFLAFFLLAPIFAQVYPGTCPGLQHGTPGSGNAFIPGLPQYNAALSGLDIAAVLADIGTLMNDSQDCWPSDEFEGQGRSYGGLFVRLSWHCSGSYRNTDEVGGCTGGRQRFSPEASWDDNTNLDKARGLLWPIKEKYGDALSWGDLFIFAGTSAIMHMGGPITEICAGRVDDANGTASAPLGPGPEQPPCPVQGDCPPPLGTDTVGLIYVNPEGFMGQPDPVQSAPKTREVFSRMGMNDSETVALIGGGHAFGRTHGACPLGAGPPPNVDPENPWPGMCGTGKGADTFTSGIEGPWTTRPFYWDNEYFQLLLNYKYEVTKGAGDKYQWKIINPDPAHAKLMMMTTDVALIYDDVYLALVQKFASDLDALDVAFSNAWAKLTTDGGIWAVNRFCIPGDEAHARMAELKRDGKVGNFERYDHRAHHNSSS